MSQVVLLAVVVPSVVGRRHDIGDAIAEHRVALEQLMLLVAACVALAAIGFGMKAWRDAAVTR